MRKSIVVFCAAGSLGLASGALAQDDIIAVAWSGDTFTIDSSTGGGGFLGSSGFSSLNSMAGDGAGTFYTFAGETLITIDPDTGQGTSQANTGLGSVRGAAMENGGDVIYVYNDEGFGDPDVFYSVDPDTGTATRIGNANHTGVQGLAFGPDGQLFAWDIGFGLLTVDISTGATTDVSGEGGTGDIQAIATGPDGTMFGARNALFEIDTSDGSFTMIGSGNYDDVRGIEFLSSPCLGLLVSDLIGGREAVWEVSGATPNSSGVVVFGFEAGETVVDDQLGFCATFGIDGVNQNRVVGRWRADGNGDAEVRRNIPNAAVGRTVLTQAAEQGTCPEECVSVVDEQVVR